MRPFATAPEPPPALAACPFCRSPKVTTTTDKVDTTSYWRCEACGEVWNAGRLRASPARYDEKLRWR